MKIIKKKIIILRIKITLKLIKFMESSIKENIILIHIKII
jgi:hypothetical protein